MVNTTQDPALPRLVASRHYEFLLVLWDNANAPMPKGDIREKVNQHRKKNGDKELAESTVSVILKEMREQGLVNVLRPGGDGKYVVVPDGQLDAEGKDPIGTRDGKTRYAASDTSRNAVSPSNQEYSDWEPFTGLLQKTNTDVLKDIAKPNFAEEVFSLQDVYVSPKAYVITERTDNPRKETRLIVDLMQNMHAWATFANPEEPDVRIISGDPGVGKSSFAKMLAAKLIAENRRVLLVPLHKLPVSVSAKEALKSAAKSEGYPPDLLDPHGPKGDFFLILDGMDELANQGAGGESAARAFASSLQTTVTECVAKGRQLRVLLCGRPIVAQHAAIVISGIEQTYYLMDYAKPKEIDDVDYLWEESIEEDSALRTDQRYQWWAKYQSKVPHEPQEMPAVLKERKLEAFTTQPLMLTLLAITYRDRDKPVTNGTGLPHNPFKNEKLPKRMADVHAFLLGRVYAQERENNRKAFGWREGSDSSAITFDAFRSLMGVLGLAAWHSGGRKATVKAVEKLCVPLELEEVLKHYRETVKADTVSLFVQFFFKHVGRVADTEEAFEFTVKPFGEYLTAIGLVDALKSMIDRWDQPMSARKYAPKWSDEKLLQDWLKITGPAELTQEIQTNLNEEIDRRVKDNEDPELGMLGRKTLLKMIEVVIPKTDEQTGELLGGFPVTDFAGRTALQLTRECNQAEGVLWDALGACLRASPLEECTDESPRFELESISQTVRQELLSWAKAREQSYWVIDTLILDKNAMAEALRRIRPHSSWRSVILPHAALIGANLERAKLFKANLFGAILDRANLVGANLVGANLGGANLRGVNLGIANLEAADLRRADLREANLRNANLAGADLRGIQRGPLTATSNSTPPRAGSF